MYFQLVEMVETQVLSTQGQPDVNLHRLTTPAEVELIGPTRSIRAKRMHAVVSDDDDQVP